LTILIICAILLLSLSIFTAYKFILLKQQNLGTPPQIVLFLVFLAVLVFPVIELISYIVSLVYIYKNKSWAYLLSSIISALIFLNGLNSMFKAKVGFNVISIVTSVFWIVLIIMSYIFYNESKKHKKNKETK